jgi:hypothetical protein
MTFMRNTANAYFKLGLLIVSYFLNCCATVETISKAQKGRPKIFSGTRLDPNIVFQEHVYLEKNPGEVKG